MLPKVSEKLATAVLERMLLESKRLTFQDFLNKNLETMHKENPLLADKLLNILAQSEEASTTLIAGLFIYRALKDQTEVNELEELYK